MSNLEADIAGLKAEHEAATRARVRAEHARDNALANAKSLRNKLKTEFGVTDLDQAKTLLASLEHDLQAKITEARAQLQQAGGQP